MPGTGTEDVGCASATHMLAEEQGKSTGAFRVRARSRNAIVVKPETEGAAMPQSKLQFPGLRRSALPSAEAGEFFNPASRSSRSACPMHRYEPPRTLPQQAPQSTAATTCQACAPFPLLADLPGRRNPIRFDNGSGLRTVLRVLFPGSSAFRRR